MGTGTITFQLSGKQVTAYLSNAAGLANMEQLAQDLHGANFSHAAIPRVTYCIGSEVDLPEGSASSTADVGFFANVLFRRTSDGKLFGLLIHAPNFSMLEAVPGQGYRVMSGDGIALAQMYSDCAGEEFTFYEGWLQGSSLRGTLAEP